MKKLSFIKVLVIVCLLVIPFASNAKHVSKAESITAANHFLMSSGKSANFSLNIFHEIFSENDILAYVFELSPKGFVVISANTILPPVIAYSFEDNYVDINETNPLLDLLRADLESRIKYFEHNGQEFILINEIKWQSILSNNNKQQQDTIFQQWPSTGNGWLTSNWTQNAPYSDFCPIDPVTSVRSIAGCPSIAMAQILNFHKTTHNTHFDNTDDYYHNYAGRQYWIDNDYLARGFPSFPILNDYLDTLSDHYLNNITLTNKDKAALTFACGVAARQVYTSSGSGTFGVDQALEAYQKFNFNTVVLLDTTDTDLFDRLMQNIKDTLPAHLAIVDPSWSSGHNVVVDGYNTDNYYHLNFGWGGSYNGWYLIPQEIPYSLTVIEGIVLDIIPSSTTNIQNSMEESSIKVFPNPCFEFATFSFIVKDAG